MEMTTERPFDLAGVVPWGRTADEYRAFLNLHTVCSTARILDCGGGPASFAAERNAAGQAVIAADPIYALTPRELGDAFEAAIDPIRRGMELARDRFVWDYYRSPDRVLAMRKAAFERFSLDRAEAPPGRYVDASLPVLPFDDDAFDLATCSHLLFLYSAQLSLRFHIDSLRELLRVAPEVRVFPLLDLDGRPSRHIDAVTAALSDIAVIAREPVAFEFQKGAREMLRLRRHG